MRLLKASSFTLTAVAVLAMCLFFGASCKNGSSSPGAYSYNAGIATMGGVYVSDVIDIHYFVSMTTNKPGTVPLAPGFGDVYSLVEYSTDGGVRYQLCNNTEGNPGDYFTFTDAPATKESTFYWDAVGDLGVNANLDSVRIRIRLFHGGADPCDDAPLDIESSQEFAVALSGEFDCGELPVITSDSLPDATDEEAYSFTFNAIGGYGDLSWSLLEPIDTNMVSGLSLSHLGILSGTPVVHGEGKGTNIQLNLDVLVSDSCPTGVREDSQNYSLMIYPQPIIVECDPAPVFAVDQSMPNGTEGEAYNYTLMLEVPGHGDVTFSVISEGSLPAGLTLNASSGVISGTPGMESSGSYDLVFQVTDSCEDPGPQSDTIDLTLIIEEVVEECDPGPSITTTSLPEGTEGEPYDYTMEATDGHGALTWSLGGEGGSDSLPAGMSFSAAGVFSGTPEESGDFPLLVEVEDECFDGAQTDFVILTLTINDPPPSCDPPPVIDVENEGNLDDAFLGLPYSYQFTAQEGHGVLTWSLTDGTLPDGLTLSSDGLLSGTVDCEATIDEYFFEVQVEDSCDDPAPQADAYTFNIQVIAYECDPLMFDATQEPPEAEVMMNYFYRFALEAEGEGDLTWALDRLMGDDLPDGLEFDGGVISGTPEVGTDGEYNIIVYVSDECPCTPQSDTFNFTLVVNLSSNPCFQSPVSNHTLCLQCPETLDIEAIDFVNVWIVLDDVQNSPAKVTLNISYDSDLVSIDEMMIAPGPSIPNPGNFSATVTTSPDVVELVYTWTMLPQPIRDTGIFALIPIQNVNDSGMGPQLMNLNIAVDVFQDNTGTTLSYDVIDCQVLVDGEDS